MIQKTGPPIVCASCQSGIGSQKMFFYKIVIIQKIYWRCVNSDHNLSFVIAAVADERVC